MSYSYKTIYLGLGLILLGIFSSRPEAMAQDTLIIKSVYFGGGSYYIDEEQIQEIFDLLEKISHLERYEISITSHTDNIGGKEYNQWLSKMRSNSVIEVLKSFAIPPERILKKDFGQENPVYNNNSFMGRRLNRRVDIIFSPLIM